MPVAPPFCTGNLDNLNTACRTGYTSRGVVSSKYLRPMLAAAEDVGASCAYLSGAGPGASGAFFAQREKERSDLADAMIQAAVGCPGRLC
jgi:homoserine kinase